MMFETDSSLYH